MMKNWSMRLALVVSVFLGTIGVLGGQVVMTPPASSGGGGAATWGSITGTLSGQSDLNTALSGKLPTAGGTVTGNVTVTGQVINTEFAAGNSGTAKTISWNNGNQQTVTLTGNVTLTFSNPATARYLLILTQDGTGSRTITWPAAVRWSAGIAPTMSTTAGAVDLCSFVYTSAGVYLGACNFAYP